MIIEKNLEQGQYHIIIRVESKTLHAHSLMTDYDNEINSLMEELRDRIAAYIDEHPKEFKDIYTG